MDEMTEALENLLLCQSLDRSDRDCVERALEEGYDALSEETRSRLRRLLNRQAVGSALSPLQRYRAHRQEVALATRHHLPKGARVPNGIRRLG